MDISIETERLILRDLRATDDTDMFALDAEALVHRFLGNNPITTLAQAQEIIKGVRQQYVDHGIGRWAVIEKETGSFVGWSGLKFITEFQNNHSHFYDVGYRLIPSYWSKGYATESAMAAILYGFTTLRAKKIYGSVNVENTASLRVLQKCGLQMCGSLHWKNIPCYELVIS